MRATGLVCLTAGAGLIRSGLCSVRGTDILRRPGGVIVIVPGGRVPCIVPTLALPRPPPARLRHGIPGTLQRRFSGITENNRGQATIRLSRRTYSPVLRQASLPETITVTWWQGRTIRYHYD